MSFQFWSMSSSALSRGASELLVELLEHSTPTHEVVQLLVKFKLHPDSISLQMIFKVSISLISILKFYEWAARQIFLQKVMLSVIPLNIDINGWVRSLVTFECQMSMLVVKLHIFLILQPSFLLSFDPYALLFRSHSSHVFFKLGLHPLVFLLSPPYIFSLYLCSIIFLACLRSCIKG